MQDWPLEVCDPGRLRDFIDAYRTPALDDDQRYALMELILYSLDEALVERRGVVAELPEIRRMLLNDYRLHEPTITYWCADDVDLNPRNDPDLPRDERVFALTPFAQEVRRAARASSGG